MNKAANRDRGSGIGICSCGRALWRRTDTECGLCQQARVTESYWMRIRESGTCACGAPCGDLRRCMNCQVKVDELEALYGLEDARAEVTWQSSQPALFVARLRHGSWLNYTLIAFLAGVAFEVGLRLCEATWAWIEVGGPFAQ